MRFIVARDVKRCYTDIMGKQKYKTNTQLNQEALGCKLKPCRWVELEDLPSMGLIKVTHVGEENVYFEDSEGNEFFYKYLG